MNAVLALEDGTWYRGVAAGARHLVLRKAKYLDAVKANGPARVHERKVSLPA